MSSLQGIGRPDHDHTWVSVGSPLERRSGASPVEVPPPAAPGSPHRWVAVKGVRRTRAPRPAEPASSPVPPGGLTTLAPPNPDWESPRELLAPRALGAALVPAPRTQARECVEIVASPREPLTVGADRVVTSRPRSLPWTIRALRIVITRSNGRRRWAFDVLVCRTPAALQRSI